MVSKASLLHPAHSEPFSPFPNTQHFADLRMEQICIQNVQLQTAKQLANGCRIHAYYCMLTVKQSEKVGLKFNIQKTKVMASSPITSWEIEGETGETVADFIFLGYKMTADDVCSHEIKRRLLLGRKVMTNLDSILKSLDSTLPTKVRLVKVMVFPVVTYGCESWTIKKAEYRRSDAFELWCWRRLLRVP